MPRTDCIFCSKPLDGSDEHIIPDSINGRLHSKEIICGACNAFFGSKLDPIIKEVFKPTMHILDMDNAQTVQVEDVDGDKYLHKKQKTVPVKPKIDIRRKDGKTYISVVGDEINAVKLLEKRAKEFVEKGYKPLQYSVNDVNHSTPFLRFEYKVSITPKLILVLNKIAIEYYAHCGLETSSIAKLIERVYHLDESLNNIVFCNWFGKIRKFDNSEISHLIIIKCDPVSKTLYAYIELFNIVCAYIPLVSNYSGAEISCCYRQDAVTGERLTGEIEITLDPYLEEDKGNNDFGILIDKFLERHRDREFEKRYTESLDNIQKQLQEEIAAGSFPKEKLGEELMERIGKAIAGITIYEFPYTVEDFKDEENDELNYIHSNMREEYFDAFCEKYKTLTGIKIEFENEGVYTFNSFMKLPFLKRNDISLVKVYCILVQDGTGNKKYILFRDMFMTISANK